MRLVQRLLEETGNLLTGKKRSKLLTGWRMGKWKLQCVPSLWASEQRTLIQNLILCTNTHLDSECVSVQDAVNNETHRRITCRQSGLGWFC